MADYKGSIKLMAERLYKNNTFGQSIVDDAYNRITCGLYIPNISSIDLSVFDEIRYPYINGVQQLDKPFYIWNGREHVDRIAWPLLKGLTWIVPDDMNGMLGVSNVHPQENTGYFRSPVNPEMYGNTYPHTGIGTSNSTAYNYLWGMNGVGSGKSWNAKYLYEMVFNTDLLPFQGLGADISTMSDGYVVAPGSVKTFLNMSNYLLMGFNSNNYPAFVTKPDTYYWNNTTDNVHYNTIGGRYDIVKITNKDFVTETVKIPTMRNINGKYYGNDFPMAIYAFLIDDDQQLWILSIADIGNNYDSWYNVTVTLTKASNVYKSYTGTDFFAETANVKFVDEGKFGFVNDYFLDLLNVKAEGGGGYDDGGPGIIGPGDKYDDESNTDGSVGGNADMSPDVTIPNISPNLGYDQFITATGYFGSYKLTVDNLKNYAKTLKILNSSKWLPGNLGDKCEQMANLIKDNTVRLFMLPISIPTSDCVSSKFNVGTKGIRKVDTLGEYSNADSVDNVLLINKLTYEYSIELGIIPHYYDNFLDFAPYSSASMYIPFIGKVEIPINLIQSTSVEEKQLKMIYRINRTNGDTLVTLLVNEIPICRWSGNCARNIQISVVDNSGMLQNQFDRLVNTTSGALKATTSAAMQNYAQVPSGLLEMATSPFSSGNPINTSSHMIGQAAESGDTGWLDGQNAILMIERPIWWKPYDYGGLVGYPTKKIAKLSTIEGFAKVTDIHIRCSATESEKERLKIMLAEGVIF